MSQAPSGTTPRVALAAPRAILIPRGALPAAGVDVDAGNENLTARMRVAGGLRGLQDFVSEAQAVLSNSQSAVVSSRFSQLVADLLVLAESALPNLAPPAAGSAAEGKALREAGVSLYNLTRRKPANSFAVCRLRLLACDCMQMSGTLATNEKAVAVEHVDLARCYASTGLLLSLHNGQEQLSTRALCEALSTGDILQRIRLAFGDSQEAHDAGFEVFEALSTLARLCFAAGTHLHTLVEVLKRNSDLIHAAQAVAQRSLRQIVDNGARILAEEGDLEKSLPFLWILAKDFEDLSSPPGARAATRARLAATLARTGEVESAMAVLSTVGANEAREPQLPVQWMGLHAAACTVRAMELAKEESMAKLASTGSVRVQTLKQDALSELAFMIRTAGDDTIASRVLLDACASLAPKTSFASTYGLLVQAKPRLEIDALVHAHTRMDGMYLIDYVNTADDAQLGRLQVSRELCDAAWQDVCRAHEQGAWELVAKCAQLHLAFCRDDHDGDAKSKSLQVLALARLHLDLPNPDGDVIQESEALTRISSLAKQALVIGQSADLRRSANCLLLGAQARLSTLDPDLRPTCSELAQDMLQRDEINFSSLLEVGKDAWTNGALDAAYALFSLAQAKASGDSELISASKQQVSLCISRREWKHAAGDAYELAQRLQIPSGHQGPIADLEWIASTLWNAASKLSLDSSASSPVSAVDAALAFADMLMACAAVYDVQNVREMSIRARVSVAGVVLTAGNRLIDQPGNEAAQLVGLCGSIARENLSKISASEANRLQLGGLALTACMFEALPMHGASNVEKSLTARVASLADDDFPTGLQQSHLVSAARIAHRLKFPDAATELYLRVLQREVELAQPDYSRAAEAAVKLMVLATSDSQGMEWAEHVERLRLSAGAHFPISALETASAVRAQFLLGGLSTDSVFPLFGLQVLWRRCGKSEAKLSLAVCWLDLACREDTSILARKESLLSEMRAALSTERRKIVEKEVSSQSEQQPQSISMTTTPGVLSDPAGESIVLRNQVIVTPALRDSENLNELKLEHGLSVAESPPVVPQADVEIQHEPEIVPATLAVEDAAAGAPKDLEPTSSESKGSLLPPTLAATRLQPPTIPVSTTPPPPESESSQSKAKSTTRTFKRPRRCKAGQA